MSDASTDPSVGLNAATGGTIAGWDHVVQSLHDIFTTPFGERVMREWYGSFVPMLLGGQLNRQDVVRHFMAITSAIEQWEPRFVITEIRPTEVTRTGELHLIMVGEYRPRAVYGDQTAEGARRVAVIGAGSAVQVREVSE